MTNAVTICVRCGSSRPTTAASATAGCSTSADSTSNGPIRYADDVITSSAYRIGLFEVESALVEHPAVAEAAVVGRDDPQRTQIVTAFVILAPGYTGSDELTVELQDHVKRVTAPYKYPREIHFVAELPKTVSGKIRRSQLRADLRTCLLYTSDAA